MPKLTIRFNDNEVLQGVVPELNLDSPELAVEVEGPSNNRGALIPLAAVKKINMGSGPADEHAAKADKMVALRFQDGEVLRGYLNGSLTHFSHGLTMTLYSPDKSAMDTVGVPYTSLKALFYVKSWDGRPPGFRRSGEVAPPLLQLLGDVREITRLYQSGAISREEFLAHRRSLLERF